MVLAKETRTARSQNPVQTASALTISGTAAALAGC